MGKLEHEFRLIGNTSTEARRRTNTAAGLDDEARYPVCVIWGAQDGTVPSAGAAEIAEFIPRAEVHVLDGHKHSITIEHEVSSRQCCWRAFA